MRIRLAVRNDYDQLLDLLRQLNPLDCKFSGIEFSVLEEIIESTYLDLIVAQDNGALLGSCYLNVIPNMTRDGRPYAVIENVITDSAHRNQGIGKALINHAMEMIRQKNCYKVMLMSGRGEGAVHAFYKKCGFDADEKRAYVMRAPF